MMWHPRGARATATCDEKKNSKSLLALVSVTPFRFLFNFMARTSQNARRSTGGQALLLTRLHRREATLPSAAVGRRLPGTQESSAPISSARGITHVVVPTASLSANAANRFRSPGSNLASPKGVSGKLEDEEVS